VLDPARAEETLPDEDGRIRLADWVWVDYSPDRTATGAHHTGLRRFGLPELQTLTAPPNVVESWGQAMTGVAHRLLAAWSETLSYDREAAFIQLPSMLEVTASDVEVAYGRSGDGKSTESATLRLALIPVMTRRSIRSSPSIHR